MNDIISIGESCVKKALSLAGKIIPAASLDKLKIHEDISNLLWIGDGDKRNYNPHNATILNAMLGISMGPFDFVLEEPSVIYTKLPVIHRKTKPAKPYVNYALRTPPQRWSYLNYLSNPYNLKADESNVMLLFYGLERYLTTDKWEAALKVIFKLNATFKNKPFGSAITKTIVNYAIHKNDVTLIKDIDFNKLPQWQYLFCAYSLDFYIPPEKLTDFANYTFTNYRYIEGERRLFLLYLKKNIISETRKEHINTRDFIQEIDNLPTISINLFNNKSLRYYYDIKIPDITKAFPLTIAFKYLMWKTHEDVKKHLAEKRRKKNKAEYTSMANTELTDKLTDEALSV